MITLENYIGDFYGSYPQWIHSTPWQITDNLLESLPKIILGLSGDYIFEGQIAVHKTAVIGKGASINGPAVIGAFCSIGPNSVLREGVLLGNAVKIGPSCEIKASILGHDTAIAHLNYIGNSILGCHINFEAGSIAANHYNERVNKTIFVVQGSETIHTGTEKFGALIGDHSKIGANAVLSPGTLLGMNSIVGRLQLVDQQANTSP
tara:strand:- start:20691 stop:21308 length:618 start_codon:yes stop_codon:yes gene_type:complete